MAFLTGTLCVVAAAWWVVRLDRQIVGRLEGKRWGLPSKIYSDSLRLEVGQSLEATHLWDRLGKLGYHQTDTPPTRKGEFYRTADRVEIFLRDFPYPERPFTGYPLVIELEEGVISRLADKKRPSRRISFAELEPQLIGGLYDKIWEERRIVTLAQVPRSLIDAVILTEDKRFYRHFGIDPVAVCRALLANLRAGRIVQGASTITQQLVKNFFLYNRRTFKTKIQGAVMALLLERHYSKDEILEAYLNEIYFGQRGIQGIYGVGEAAHFYFGKTVEKLDLEESAFLAALIRAPSMYSPHRNPELIRARRNRVLEKMYRSGMITEEDFHRCRSAPITVKPLIPQLNEAPYFIDHVIEELTEDFSIDFLTSEGLSIFTTLDPELNAAAQAALERGLAAIEERHSDLLEGGEEPGDPRGRLQGCLVVLDARTGHIKVLIGGRTYRKGGMNRATQARRQPGSLFKPIVYVTALERGGQNGERFTPTSPLLDEPITIQYDHKQWSPRNYNDQYFGTVSLRKALEMSLNCATVRLSRKVGLGPIIETARSMGLSTPVEPLPSLALGAFEAIPLELVGAYAVLANQGVFNKPRAIKAIVDREGKVVAQRRPRPRRIVSRESAFLTTYLLQGVIERGTASASRDDITFPAAGKTGTTNNYQDAWFCGYTPTLVTLVWVGFDRPRSTGLTGGQAALPIWTSVMNYAASRSPQEEFAAPPGIVFRKIDRTNGLLATSTCPQPLVEAFRSGTEPEEYCPLHPERKTLPETIIELPKGVFEKFLKLFK